MPNWRTTVSSCLVPRRAAGRAQIADGGHLGTVGPARIAGKCFADCSAQHIALRVAFIVLAEHVNQVRTAVPGGFARLRLELSCVEIDCLQTPRKRRSEIGQLISFGRDGLGLGPPYRGSS